MSDTFRLRKDATPTEQAQFDRSDFSARLQIAADMGATPEDWAPVTKEAVKRTPRRRQRTNRDQVYRDLGMVKVRGALGGTYYE